MVDQKSPIGVLDVLHTAGKLMIIDVFWRTARWRARRDYHGAKFQEYFRSAVAEARKHGYADDELLRYADRSVFPARYSHALCHVTKPTYDLHRALIGRSRSINQPQAAKIVADDSVQLLKSKLGQRHIHIGCGWSASFARPDQRDTWRGDHDLAHDFQDRKWRFSLSYFGMGISDTWLAASEEAASSMWSQAIDGRLDDIDDYTKIQEIHHIPRLSVPWLATGLLNYAWYYQLSPATLQKAETLERCLASALLEASGYRRSR